MKNKILECLSKKMVRGIKSQLGLAVLLILLNGTNTWAQVPSYVPTNGLVGWWPFNGNANDESGNGNNGTVNGATLTADRNGVANAAYSFDGVNDFIDVADNNSLCLLNTDFTINSWVYPNNLNGNHIWYKGQSSGNNFPKYVFRLNNNLYAFHINGPGFNTGLWYYSNTSPISNWQMATVIKQGNVINFYFNSILSSSTSINSALPNTTGQNARIGGAEPNGSGWWNGKLDDICIWNRALTQNEITQLYTGSVSGINPIEIQSYLKVYPNPSSSQITIDFGANYNTLAGYTMRIQNAVGQTVYTTGVTQQMFTSNLSTWTGNGVYFVYLIDAQGNTVDVKKIILQ